jgi:hypothetical protein
MRVKYPDVARHRLCTFTVSPATQCKNQTSSTSAERVSYAAFNASTILTASIKTPADSSKSKVVLPSVRYRPSIVSLSCRPVSWSRMRALSVVSRGSYRTNLTPSNLIGPPPTQVVKSPGTGGPYRGSVRASEGTEKTRYTASSSKFVGLRYRFTGIDQGPCDRPQFRTCMAERVRNTARQYLVEAT